MQSALIIVLLFAQQTTHFVRLPMPSAFGWRDQHRERLICEGDFVIPSDGRYTIRYASLACGGEIKPPQDYSKKNFPVAPMFCDHLEEVPYFDKNHKLLKARTCPGGNQVPIYDIDESYDHITVMSTPGVRWWYTVTIAVPAVVPSKVQ